MSLTSVKPETHSRLRVDVVESLKGATYNEIGSPCIHPKQAICGYTRYSSIESCSIEKKYDLHVKTISIIISIDFPLNSMS